MISPDRLPGGTSMAMFVVSLGTCKQEHASRDLGTLAFERGLRSGQVSWSATFLGTAGEDYFFLLTVSQNDGKYVSCCMAKERFCR